MSYLRTQHLLSFIEPLTNFPTGFMLLKVHPKPYKTGSDSKLQNMLVATFNEMVLFHQSLRRSSKLNPGLQELPRDDGTTIDFDEVLIRYASPTSPPPDFPGAREASEIAIPLRPDIGGLAKVPISLHHSDTIGYDMGSVYNDWFSACFGYKVMLVYLGPSLRTVLGNVSPSAANARSSAGQDGSGGAKSWLGSITSSVPTFGLGSLLAAGSEHEDEGPAKITFADCSAYLVVTVESLADVSSRLPEGEEMDITKFRPNIVLSGSTGAWEEDFWGSLEFRSPKQGSREGTEGRNEEGERTRMLLTANCGRCVSINIDYETGRQGKGKAGTMLKKLMHDRRIDRGNKWSPVFGRYGFLDRVRGDEWPVVRIGDEVVVAESNEERTTWRKHSVFFQLSTYLVRLTLLLFRRVAGYWKQ